MLLALDFSYSIESKYVLGTNRISFTENANYVPLSSLLKLLVQNFDSENAFFTSTVDKKDSMDDIREDSEYLCVFFNHFIELSKSQNITVDLLKKGMHRCCAFQTTKEGTEGIDLIIPCFWSNSGELAGTFSVLVKAEAEEHQHPSKNVDYLSKLLPNHFLEQKDLVEFGEKRLRSFGLLLHICGDDKRTQPKNTTNVQIFDNKALLFKLRSYITSEEATKDLYLESLDERQLVTILSNEQIKEIKKLLNVKSLKHISEKLRNLQENESLYDFLDKEPKEPYIIKTLNVCCHWNNSKLAQFEQFTHFRNSIEQIVELVKFLPAIKKPFSGEESLAFYEEQFAQIKKSLLPV